MRGSHLPSDWTANYNYTLSTREAAAAAGLAGRVHVGFMQYVVSMASQIDAEVMRVRPRKVTVVGDSLGGGVAVLAGLYIAQKFQPILAENVSHASQVSDLA